MRSTHLVIGFSSLVMVIGGVAAGCGSSSKAPVETTTTDAAATDGGEEAAATCTATTDAGSLSTYVSPAGPADSGINGTTVWACEKAACTTQVAACAAEACCNATILDALICSDTATGATALITCFGTAAVSPDTTVQAMVACLEGAMSSCGISLPDAGKDGAVAADTGTGSETSTTVDSGAGEQ
jgi:hypothetical protein